MGLQDKTLQCVACGASFTFTGGEQEFYQSKGYTNEPKRCPNCRQTRRNERGGGENGGGGGFRAPRQMFPATCGGCGKETEVPFQPRGDRPVYCSDCYNKNKTAK